MIRDRESLPRVALKGDAALLEKAFDVGRVVDDVVVAAQLGELVSDLMEAVRAAGDDSQHVVAIERLDRVLREHLIQVLVAHPARRVAVAMLFLPEDREPDAARLENPRERDADLLRAIVE